jgi:hypothetical protein
MITAARIWAAFFMRGILHTEVFNTFVENAVQNQQSTCVSGSLRNASTLCTEVSAGTFVEYFRK